MIFLAAMMGIVCAQKPYWLSDVRGNPESVWINEGANKTISCAAMGIPKPVVSVRKVCGLWIGDDIVLNAVSRDCSGEYECKASNHNGFISRTIALRVNYPPAVLKLSVSGRYSRRLVHLACLVDPGYPRGHVTWLFNGELLRNDKRSFQLYQQDHGRNWLAKLGLYVRIGDAGNYTCRVQNALGRATKTRRLTPAPNPYTVFVQPPAVYVRPPAAEYIVVKEGAQLTLFCQPATKWERGNTGACDFSPSVTSQVSIRDATRGCSGTYWCLSRGGVREKIFRLQVSVRPTIKAVFPPKLYRNVGGNFTAECSSDPQTVIQWTFHNGVSEKRIMASVISLPNIREADFGTYTCKATNSVGQTKKSLELIRSPRIIRLFINRYEVDQLVYVDCVLDGKYDVQWLFRGDDVPAERKRVLMYRENPEGRWVNTLGVLVKTEADLGEYTCVVNGGVKRSLWVNDTGRRSSVSSGWNDLTITEGGDLQIFCQGDIWKASDGLPTRCLYTVGANKRHLTFANITNDCKGLVYCYERRVIFYEVRVSALGRKSEPGRQDFPATSTFSPPGDRHEGDGVLESPGFAPEITRFPFKVIAKGTGERYQINCTVTAIPRPRVEWSFNETLERPFVVTKKDLSDNQTIVTLTIPSVTPRNYGTYTCHALNSVGGDTESWNLSPPVPPSVPFKPEIKDTRPSAVNESRREFSEASCVVKGSPLPKIMWILNGSRMCEGQFYSVRKWPLSENATSLNMIFNRITSKKDGGCICFAMNYQGSAKKPWELKPFQIAPKIKDFPSSVVHADLGHSFKIRCEVHGFPLPRVSWLLNGTGVFENILYEVKRRVLSENRVSLDVIFPQIKHYNYGRYTCRASNAQGADSKSWELAPFLDLKMMRDSPRGLSFTQSHLLYFEGASLTLHCTLTGGPIVWGTSSGKNHCLVNATSSFLVIKNITRDCAVEYFCDDTKRRMLFRVGVYDASENDLNAAKDPSSSPPPSNSFASTGSTSDLTAPEHSRPLVSSGPRPASSPESFAMRPESLVKTVDESRSDGSTLYRSLAIYVYLSCCCLVATLLI